MTYYQKFGLLLFILAVAFWLHAKNDIVFVLAVFCAFLGGAIFLTPEKEAKK